MYLSKLPNILLTLHIFLVSIRNCITAYINIQICWYCTDTFVNIYVIANSFTQYFPNKYLYKFIDHKFPGNSWINLSSQLSPKYGDMKNIGNINFFLFFPACMYMGNEKVLVESSLEYEFIQPNELITKLICVN